MSNSAKKVKLLDSFTHASKTEPVTVPYKPKPFSLRLTLDERTYLDKQAGDKPLGAYIRDTLLSENTRKRRRLRNPNIDQQQLALLLSTLGESRLASNLNQLAHHANIGTLVTSEALEQKLREASLAIIEMRNTLLTALGLRQR